MPFSVFIILKVSVAFNHAMDSFKYFLPFFEEYTTASCTFMPFHTLIFLPSLLPFPVEHHSFEILSMTSLSHLVCTLYSPIIAIRIIIEKNDLKRGGANIY